MHKWSGSAGVCVNENAELLMILQGKPKEKKKWSIPSGGREKGETFEACCIREVEEETGYIVEVVEKIKVKRRRYENWNTVVEVHYFLVQIVGGSRNFQDPDQLIYDIAWKTTDEIKTLDLSFPEDREFLIEYLMQNIDGESYMEIVNFNDTSLFKADAEKAFLSQVELIKEYIPEADIQHVGSTAIPNSLTKGDLDIQVRVNAEQFPEAVKALASLYEINEGSIKTDAFRAFKNDTMNPPLGVQLTVIGSEFDFFWKFREVLLRNDTYRLEYDELKRTCEGKDMDEYREAKDAFFTKIMKSPDFRKLDDTTTE